MSKLDWEKQKKAEQPKEKRWLGNRSKVLLAYANGTKNEQARILKLIDAYKGKPDFTLDNLKSLIKGKQK
jgi:hypothetical protein